MILLMAGFHLTSPQNKMENYIIKSVYLFFLYVTAIFANVWLFTCHASLLNCLWYHTRWISCDIIHYWTMIYNLMFWSIRLSVFTVFTSWSFETRCDEKGACHKCTIYWAHKLSRKVFPWIKAESHFPIDFYKIPLQVFC